MKKAKKQNNRHSFAEESRRKVEILLPLLFCIMLGTVECCFIRGFYLGLKMNKILSSEGITVNGKIISLEGSRWNNGKGYNDPIIEFIDHKGKKHQFKSPYSTDFHIGESIPIVYAKSNSKIVSVPGEFEKRYNLHTFLLVSGVFLFSIFLLICQLVGWARNISFRAVKV